MASKPPSPGPLADPDRLLDKEELAAELKVSPRTIEKWAELGKGPRRLRVGKYVRYRAADVKTWLDSQYVD